MPLSHFEWSIYLILIYDRFESQDLIKFKLKNDLYDYDLEMNVSFRVDDKFKEILLKVKPQELKLEIRDKEGEIIKTLKISSDIDYKEMEDSVKITFNKLEIIK
jgi:hypothetical protein